MAITLNAAGQLEGFQNAKWGMSPDEIRKLNNPKSWSAIPAGNDFPPDLKIKTFSALQEIAGQQASVKYYFCDEKFFQATARFNFDRLKTFDFNYNVYRSVDSYYRAIHEQTLNFVFDIFDLLRKKYGQKDPQFKGSDPRFLFRSLDDYIGKEAWNLRFYPYDYYKKIVASAYAVWDHPGTRITFSIIINAPDKQFDYLLSLTSKIYGKTVNERKDSLRIQNL
jgi:hypothetical protein